MCNHHRCQSVTSPTHWPNSCPHSVRQHHQAGPILPLQGFSASVNAILDFLPRQRQTMLFSATQTKSVKDLARLSLADPEYISAHAEAAAPTPLKLQQVGLGCHLAAPALDVAAEVASCMQCGQLGIRSAWHLKQGGLASWLSPLSGIAAQSSQIITVLRQHSLTLCIICKWADAQAA